jgi:tetratricopeptide (TPR) repeat protein
VSLKRFFSGPSPEKIEVRGDALCKAGQWGQARQTYAQALARYEKSGSHDSAPCRRVRDKIHRACDALAREHQATAANYHEGGYPEEAREMLTLAMEISHDDALRAALAEQLAALDVRRDTRQMGVSRLDMHTPSAEAPEEEAPLDTPTPEELFRALCHTLPDEIRTAYRGYGQPFVDGYIALNQGDFETAAEHLEQAMADNARPDSYIPLELATAYMNMDRWEDAQGLLEQVRLHHPEALPAYRLLCEIYWEQREFARAEALLDSLPPHLSRSRAAMHLKGETLVRAGRYETARQLYRRVLDTFGWDDATAQALAATHEHLNETAEARALYGEIISRCTGCRTRVDPRVKHQYAEISFTEGIRDSALLELYLALAREIPAHADVYFERISAIYDAQGNATEHERFRAFAERARAEKTNPASGRNTGR